MATPIETRAPATRPPRSPFVVLAEKPIDAAAITNAADHGSAISTQMGSANASYVAMTFNDGEDSPAMNLHVSGGSNGMAGGFKCVFTVNDGKRIEGHRTNDPNRRKDNPTDLTFALPIASTSAGADHTLIGYGSTTPPPCSQ